MKNNVIQLHNENILRKIIKPSIIFKSQVMKKAVSLKTTGTVNILNNN